MSQKKRAVTETTAQKQQLKNNLSTYIERYREIELYLTLLTKPLVSSVIATSPVGLNHLHDKVEAEIKAFLEEKLQILTGMIQPTVESGLSSAEVSALKMIASKVLVKEPQPPKEEVIVPDLPVQKVIQQLEEEEEEPSEPVVDNDSVLVEQIEESPVIKQNKRRNKKVVAFNEVPNVEKGVPTDTMKKVRPAGAKQPLPHPRIEQENSMAAMQAEAMQEQLLLAQMQQAQTVLPDNLGMPNLNGPMFR